MNAMEIVSEYTELCINELNTNELMQNDIKEKKIGNICAIYEDCSEGYMTIHEAMFTIAKVRGV